MSRPKIETFARELSPETTKSVRAASRLKTETRMPALRLAFDDVDAARTKAEEVKEYVLDNLRDLLGQLSKNCKANGIIVHWARDAEEARNITLEICREHAEPGDIISKAKSMATEEIHLNGALEEAGFVPVETDLGEYVVQIDGDTPSHIVTPIIHKNRRQIAESFNREGLGPYTEEPTELTHQARTKLRDLFRQAKIGISGINFAIASTGRLVLVENEGNNRFSTTAPDVHIALMGIEKLLPSEDHLPLFLRLLAGSATAQKLTVYTHLISGPRREDELDGPRHVHLIMLDNGRVKALTGPYRSILRCIRCGACLNVCPVYRQVSGHGYREVYSGPLGAVLGPALKGVHAVGDLAKASTLCGACEEVCPVKIPFPDLLLKIRDQAVREQAFADPIPWKWFGKGAEEASRWKIGLKLLPLAISAPSEAKAMWDEFREVPERQGQDFRRWWRERH